MARSSLHLLSLRKRLLNNKEFLKSLAISTPNIRNKILKRAKPQQLRTLQLLLSSLVRGDIEISSLTYSKLKKSKKLPFLLQNFERVKPTSNLTTNIIKVSSILPLILKPLLQKKTK